MANVEHNALTGANLHEPKGIDLASVGETYVAAGGGTGNWQLPAFTGLVAVAKKDDFPTPALGVITLAINTTYVITADVDLISDTILYSAGSNIIGFNRDIDVLRTNSAQALISSVNQSFLIQGVRLANPSGTLIDASGGGTFTALLDTILLDNCVTAITLTDFRGVAMDRVAIDGNISGTNGIKFTGTFVELFVRHCYFKQWTGNLFDFVTDSPLFDLIAFIGTRFFGTASLVAINGLAASANVNDFGAVLSTIFDDMTTPVTGILKSDVKWVFKSCAGTENSAIIGYVNMSGNATDTVISGTGAFVSILGTTAASSSNEEFSSPGDNQLQFNGVRAVQVALACHASTERVGGGGSDVHQITFYKNSLIMDANIKGTGSSSAGTIQSVSIIGIDTAEPGDIYSVYVANTTNTNDVTVTDLQFSIIGAGL